MEWRFGSLLRTRVRLPPPPPSAFALPSASRPTMLRSDWEATSAPSGQLTEHVGILPEGFVAALDGGLAAALSS